MNRQEAFNKVSRALLAQGKKSMVESRGTAAVQCCYVDKDNNRCAVGHLIPDHLAPCVASDVVNEARIQALADFLKLHNAEDIADFLINEQSFCRDLQIIHDSSDVLNWQEALLTFAKAWSLETSTLGVPA